MTDNCTGDAEGQRLEKGSTKMAPAEGLGRLIFPLLIRSESPRCLKNDGISVTAHVWLVSLE